MFDKVPQRLDFPAGEKEILAFWKDAGIFEKSMSLREGADSFVFFEGPPTANGTPHNGHVLTRVIKDLFPRYKTMRGYHVPRKAGWDTHGLPVEVAVERELGIHGKAAIEEYGVEAFTQKCIESVFRYTDVWESLTERIGFWVDLDDAYVTFHKSYVESVWWALSELFKKGLLYKGHKVVWWWPQGGTALSSAEVGLGYKTVDDPSVTVKFELIDEPGTYFLGWTTTPWTLPSNCALAVKESATYAFALKDGQTYVVAEALLDKVLGEDTYEVVGTKTGAELAGTRYRGVFEYATPESGKFREVITADFVEIAATGLVHVAPAFGEDDYKAAKDKGIGILQLVKPDGCFTDEVTDFAGRFCKEADRDIIRDLRRRDLLFKEEVYRHDYPFCWRADEDPLIQYARPAWFIRTTERIDRAIENNQKIGWFPPHIKDGRFGDFLANNVDWALSRERFWGTPLNIWTCESCATQEAPASVAEITERNPHAFDHFKAAQAQDPSLSEHLAVHKPWVDEVTFPCSACSGTMTRVTEVIDCWFDSGCMPFAQWGWPHQNSDKLDSAWPADFISEGIDQTRGWYYSLLMVSSLLFEDKAFPHPYKNCIVLGHVCDKTGKKESKSKGNYTPPDAILESDGADAMRWYFYAANPPQSNTRYSPEAVRQGQQEFLVKVYNVYSFFVIYARIDGFNPATTAKRPVAERALLDRWILSETQLALTEVTERMDGFLLYDASQRIIALADALSNWYVRRSRSRFWAPGDGQDKWDAFHTLYEVLVTITKMTAPFVPFITERLYQNLVRTVDSSAPESVHLCDWPTVDAQAVDRSLSAEMQVVRDVVSVGQQTRATHKLKVRQPLRRVQVVLAERELAAGVAAHQALIKDELNVKDVVFIEAAKELVDLSVKPNYRALGPVFGKRMPVVRKALDAADPNEVLAALNEHGRFELALADGEVATLTTEHVQVAVIAREGYAAASGRAGVVILDTNLDDELIAEGRYREVLSRVQTLRKQANLDYTDRIRVSVVASESVLQACKTHQTALAQETLADEVSLGSESGTPLEQVSFELEGNVTVAIERA